MEGTLARVYYRLVGEADSTGGRSIGDRVWTSFPHRGEKSSVWPLPTRKEKQRGRISRSPWSFLVNVSGNGWNDPVRCCFDAFSTGVMLCNKLEPHSIPILGDMVANSTLCRQAGVRTFSKYPLVRTRLNLTVPKRIVRDKQLGKERIFEESRRSALPLFGNVRCRCVLYRFGSVMCVCLAGTNESFSMHAGRSSERTQRIFLRTHVL